MKHLLLLILTGIFIYTSDAQRVPLGTIRVADETEYVPSGESAFRIVTVNDSIASKLITKFTRTWTRYTCTLKEDKKHKELYFEYSIYFKSEDSNTVMAFISTNFH